MKRVIPILLSLMLIVSVLPAAAAEIETGVTVALDDQTISFPDQQPVIMDGRTLIPVRGLFEEIGADVKYTEAAETVEILYRELRIAFRLNTTAVDVTENGSTRQVTLDVPAVLMNERAMVPLRFVAETVGYDVEWDEANRTVRVWSVHTEVLPPGTVPTPTAAPAVTAGPEAVNKAIQKEAQVSVDRNKRAAVKADGSLWTWTAENGEEKAPVREGIQDAVAVDHGRDYIAALLTDGTVWTKGTIAQYPRGANYTKADELRQTTWQRVDGLDKIVQIGAGSQFLAALDQDGRVWTLGKNDKGQLGSGDTEEKSGPYQVSALPKVTKLAAGSGHAAALTSDGKIYTWGENGERQLGRNPRVKSDSTPRAVSSLIKMVDVAAGSSQTAAARVDGSTYMWGTTYVGLPADGEENFKDEDGNEADGEGYYRYAKPTRMRLWYYDDEELGYFTKYFTDTEMLSCGEYQTAALRDGHLFGWGDTPLVRRNRNSQGERYYAQEYDGLEAAAVYGGQNGELWAAGADGGLWKITYDGKAEVISLK